ncbi:O-antigen ligase family protein [Microbacterium sp. ASV49]|uniref:O-antigen ligase domain-containing protein n=1 Tax=Microbacterium candidum TaxID=3041922 RepID=A0ABT7MUY3_9MICO|nr:O-antigen ligase family protein [Microbacterium sp. ASV49]MDL9978265.1 O-antigen ligase domain-containing protein [Microbacterium sp. ASV49]
MRTDVWFARLAEWWAGAWRWMLMAAGAVVAVYILLTRVPDQSFVTSIALAGLVIAAALTARTSLAIALMAVPALFIPLRAGLGGADLSVSDLALAAAFGTAILLGNRNYSRPLRAMLWLDLVYQFATLLTVIVVPYTANTVEWFHAWLLVSGALIAGWALGRGGYARLAFLLMIWAGCVIAVGTVIGGLVQYVHGDFGPVYPSWPFGMQKNFAGTVMAFVALIAYANPAWMALSIGWARFTFWFLCIGIVMTQSRQALAGLIVAIVIIALRKSAGGVRHSRFILLLLIPGVWMIVSMVLDQISSDNVFNSVHQRFEWLRAMYGYWKEAPVFGHGLRFWTQGGWADFQPPQAEIEVLVSVGAVGLLAFLVMWVGMLIVLWRVDPVYGTLAFAAILSRLVQAQFDLFWVAAAVSIPFVIAGICLGAQALQRTRDEELLKAEAALV